MAEMIEVFGAQGEEPIAKKLIDDQLEIVCAF